MRRRERSKERRDVTMGEQGQHGLRSGHGGAEEDGGWGWECRGGVEDLAIHRHHLQSRSEITMTGCFIATTHIAIYASMAISYSTDISRGNTHAFPPEFNIFMFGGASVRLLTEEVEVVLCSCMFEEVLLQIKGELILFCFFKLRRREERSWYLQMAAITRLNPNLQVPVLFLVMPYYHPTTTSWC